MCEGENDVREQLKIIGFATTVCLVCSILLAVVSSVLTPLQEANKANDIKTKVLQVFGVTNAAGQAVKDAETIEKVFAEQITGLVLDAEGKVVAGKEVAALTPEEINKRDKATGLKKFYPLYIYTDAVTANKLYAVHVSGKGLWSTIKGYMALEEDLDTVFGIVFYENAETPGLGAEVDKPYFQDQFKGKKWLTDGAVNKFRIIKPGGELNDHTVDGITAATMTCVGVEIFLNEDFAVYNRYFTEEGLRK